ncbi:pyridoxine/pyridoxamine 5'-phosphate oxidase [Ornithinibacillus scapharcae]|uniref:pyridoxine/pyridoxamine 5'-phosphate oxidase n=1 Tax=Ornithinibacillus scapharcae TaxID=1147159 RepID=UPI000225BCFB|nr:pyridoxal 5'-phosphate synthase [Ornithinibacillus scapharcae]
METIREVLKNSKTLQGPFPEFHSEQVSDTPQELFLIWYQMALEYGVPEPHAMTLSTVDEAGFPDARILILKDIDQSGWYFSSSSMSEKGKQLANNPHVAITFYWSAIGRQIRIRGQASIMGKELSARDFLNRGKVARALALIGKQSSVLKDHQELDEALVDKLLEIEQNPNTVNPNWTLYRVEAKEVEFWQANEERKHIRLKYYKDREKWLKQLLWC